MKIKLAEQNITGTNKNLTENMEVKMSLIPTRSIRGMQLIRNERRDSDNSCRRPV